MSEELMPCPWCGELPEIVEYDDGCFGVACRSHGWTGYDGNGIRTSADVAVYAEARLERDPETGGVLVPVRRGHPGEGGGSRRVEPPRAALRLRARSRLGCSDL